MTCPICDNKPANCDCTARERELFEEVARLREALDELLELASENHPECSCGCGAMDEVYASALDRIRAKVAGTETP